MRGAQTAEGCGRPARGGTERLEGRGGGLRGAGVGQFDGGEGAGVGRGGRGGQLEAEAEAESGGEGGVAYWKTLKGDSLDDLTERCAHPPTPNRQAHMPTQTQTQTRSHTRKHSLTHARTLTRARAGRSGPRRRRW